MNNVIICPLGRVDYAEAWDLQKRVQSRLIEAKRAELPELVPHVLLLVEHPPVYTLGKSGKLEHLLLSEARLAEKGASFFHIGRGGDITFHGPGQLVGYPILDLDRVFTDLGRYLRTLEEVMIATCADFGITAGRSQAGTGVWVGPDERGSERKICAFGIRCSRWVTMHGFALNINTDLSFFDHIVPCGIRDKSVTSLAAELGRPVDEAHVRQRVITHFSRCFELSVEVLDKTAAWAYVEAFTAREALIP